MTEEDAGVPVSLETVEALESLRRYFLFWSVAYALQLLGLVVVPVVMALAVAIDAGAALCVLALVLPIPLLAALPIPVLHWRMTAAASRDLRTNQERFERLMGRMRSLWTFATVLAILFLGSVGVGVMAAIATIALNVLE